MSRLEKKYSLDIIRGHLKALIMGGLVKALMWNHSAVMFEENFRGGGPQLHTESHISL